MFFIYENHLGGFYWTEYELDYDDLYCDSCGDSDWFVGTATNVEEAKALLDSGIYDEEFINEFVDSIPFE